MRGLGRACWVQGGRVGGHGERRGRDFVALLKGDGMEVLAFLCVAVSPARIRRRGTTTAHRRLEMQRMKRRTDERRRTSLDRRKKARLRLGHGLAYPRERAVVCAARIGALRTGRRAQPADPQGRGKEQTYGARIGGHPSDLENVAVCVASENSLGGRGKCTEERHVRGRGGSRGSVAFRAFDHRHVWVVPGAPDREGTKSARVAPKGHRGAVGAHAVDCIQQPKR